MPYLWHPKEAALLVDDLPKLISTLAVAGIEVRNDESLEGYPRVYVDDPFGNRIELMEAVSPSGTSLENVPW
jgi:hypothetical protein